MSGDRLRDELILKLDDAPTIADSADLVDDIVLPVVQAHIDAAVARAEAAEQAVQRVRELHYWVPSTGLYEGFCNECGSHSNPCATIRALDGPP